MKKLTVLLLTVLAFAVVSTSFVSCNGEPDDPENPEVPVVPVVPEIAAGFYQPGKKVSRMYAQVDEGPEQILQDWVWNGDKLVSISYFDDGEFLASDEFVYENNRLAKIYDDQGYFAKYIYDNTKYDKIEYYSNSDVLVADLQFKYEGKKIIMVTINNYSIEKNVMNLIERGFMGKLLSADEMKVVAEKLANSTKETTTVSFTYEGDNVSEVGIGNYVTTYSNYDTHANMLYTFFPFMPYNGTLYHDRFSKNNPGKTTIQVGTSTVTTVFTYTYTDNFPTTIQATKTYGGYSSVTKTRIVYN